MNALSISDLSIVITTYNRPHFLSALVRHIRAFDCPITIHIFDNGSDQETVNICGSLISNFRNIFYHRSGINEGFDASMSRVAAAAERKQLGTYSIWLADDDYVNLTHVQSMIDMLNAFSPAFVHYKTAMFERKDGKLSFFPQSDFTSDQDVKMYKDPSVYLWYVWKVIPAFCGIIVRNDMLKVSDFTKYDGTYHAYAGALAEIAARLSSSESDHPILYINDPTKPFGFFCGYSNKTWALQTKRVLVGIRKLMGSLPSTYNDQVRHLWKSYKSAYYSHPTARDVLEEEMAEGRLFFE